MRRYLRAIRKSINCNIKNFFENLGIILMVLSLPFLIIDLFSPNILLIIIALLLAIPGFIILFIILTIDLIISFKVWFRDFIDRVKSNLEE